jgi:hypothetical protein
MRGNAAFVLLLVGLVCSGPTLLTAQNQGAGLFVFSVPGGVQVAGQVPATSDPAALAPAIGDLLEFADGSIMHGELKRMNTASGLRWDNPAAKKPIDLQPGHIDSIRFAHAGAVPLIPTSRLRFVNGDDLFGSVTSLDDDHLGFNTWFGRSLTVPRASVQSITFLSSNYSILYEGPGDAEGWIIGNHNPDSWIFRDGTFISESSGLLGRDFNLSGSSTIEFDLAWSDKFEFLVSIYSDALDLHNGSAYLLEITSDQVNLRHTDPGRQAPPRNFGSAPLPILAGKNKARITIQSNKDEGTVAVFVDNILAKRWKDENGFSAVGSGLLFWQAGTDAVLKLSNLKISQWEGRFEPETSAVMTNVDAIRFINHDQAAGKITGIKDGKVTLAMGETVLQIPIQRVTQVNFAAGPVAAATRGPWEVRAHFPHGGSLSFQLEKWDDKEVSGRSAIFGPLAFQPGQIRQLEFNLDHTKTAAPVMGDRELEGLDE